MHQTASAFDAERMPRVAQVTHFSIDKYLAKCGQLKGEARF